MRSPPPPLLAAGCWAHRVWLVSRGAAGRQAQALPAEVECLRI
jgi:hypothetical protein